MNLEKITKNRGLEVITTEEPVYHIVVGITVYTFREKRNAYLFAYHYGRQIKNTNSKEIK